MIILDHQVCQIQMPKAEASYERVCAYLTDPTDLSRGQEKHAFMFMDGPNVRYTLQFNIDVKRELFPVNSLYVTTARPGQKDDVKIITSSDAVCYVKNGKPGCQFTVKGGEIVRAEVK